MPRRSHLFGPAGTASSGSSKRSRKSSTRKRPTSGKWSAGRTPPPQPHPLPRRSRRRETRPRRRKRTRGGGSHRRDFHSAAPPSPFSRCFNSDGESTSAKWQNSRRRRRRRRGSVEALASLIVIAEHAVGTRPAAALPMDNPYCSCHGLQLQSLWIIPAAAVS